VSRGTIVVATELPFWRDVSGAAQRIGALCRYLAEQDFDTVVYYPAWVSRNDVEAFSGKFPGVFLETPALHLLGSRFVRRRLQPFLHPDRAKAPVTPGTRHLTRERRQGFEHLCDRIHPHAVIVEYAMFAYIVDEIATRTERPALLLDTVDVVSARTERFQAKGVTPSIQATEEEEAEIFARFDFLIAIQQQEADLVRHLAPEKTVLIAGHPHPIASFSENRQQPVRLLFVGATAQHNKHALMGFLENVWPRFWETHAGKATLDVVGTVAKNLDPGKLPEGVNLVGPVEDLDEAYRRADICINPAFIGSGLKIKNVEALCHGRPLVTTPVGAEGLEAAAPTGGMLVCESYEAVLRDVIKLVDDPAFRSTCACAAHAYAANHLTPEKVFAALGRCLDEIVATGGGPHA
jgi:glycosyltransferase involved in cell wall biosynthesis